MSTKNAIAKKEEGGALAMSADEVTSMFGNSTLDTRVDMTFNTVKIIRETAQFSLSEDEQVKTLTGHILLMHKANQWWEVPYDKRTAEDSPVPNCYSSDGLTPDGGDKVQCDKCPMCKLNQFGTGKDEKGKACRNSIRFLFLQDGAVLPIIIVAPPTSLKKKGSVQQWINDYPNKVAAAMTACGISNKDGLPVVDYWLVHVELSLEKKKFDSGEASILQIKTLEVVTPGTDEGAQKLRNLFVMVSKATETYEQEKTAYIENEDDRHDGATNTPETPDDEIPI